jgi:regulator of protease activity HflC (stomatin/prohibitin superfamily)
MIREREYDALPGIPIALVLLGVALFSGYELIQALGAADARGMLPVVGWLLLLVFAVFLLAGLFVVNPNEAKVLQFFGSYVGTAKQPGMRWANPLYTKRRLSQRVRNFESSHLKVNDNEGNPIEIAAVVVWRVVETAEAVFEVDDYNNYVKVQSEAALRNLATSYTYDSHDDAQMSLRGHTTEVAEHLKKEIQDRLMRAGVEVMEARISHLAYAPEIAQAMLQRQQAGAIIAARQRIVEGAVGMVEMALDMLSRRDIVTLDNERKAAMVSNLLVVLCSERATQPIVNTGTIYQ